ncbi:MAG TPA: hypothetical protein VIM88_08160 [Sulfurovum sp.]
MTPKNKQKAVSDRKADIRNPEVLSLTGMMRFIKRASGFSEGLKILMKR